MQREPLAQEEERGATEIPALGWQQIQERAAPRTPGKRQARGLVEVRDCRPWTWSPEVTGDLGKQDPGCR